MEIESGSDAEDADNSDAESADSELIGDSTQFVASPGTYDHKHVYNTGRVKQCIAYGPGLLHLAHQPDEYCSIDDLVQSCKVMALTMVRLLEFK